MAQERAAIRQLAVEAAAIEPVEREISLFRAAAATAFADEEGGDHRVKINARQLDAVVGENYVVELNVMSSYSHFCPTQERCQLGQHGVNRRLLRVVESRRVPDRHVVGLPAAETERKAGDVRRHRLARVGLQIEDEGLLLADRLHDPVERLFVAHDREPLACRGLGGGRCGGAPLLRQARHQRPELQLAEEVPYPRRVVVRIEVGGFEV